MKRFITVLATICCLCVLWVPTYAEPIEPLATDLIVTSKTVMQTGSSGKVSAIATISASRASDKLGFSKIVIQEQTSGGWSAVKTVTGQYGFDRSKYIYTATYTGISGKKYRAVTSFYAKAGTLVETISSKASSNIVTAK
ncbi:MAG: hypothetical protein RSE59_08370 [Clostridia bacterium]